MKFICFLIGICAFNCCRSPETEIELESFVQRWDSLSVSSLVRVNDTFQARALVIAKSLKIEEHDSVSVDLLKREEFVRFFDKLHIKYNSNSKILIFEIRDSGEEITNKKAIVILPEGMIYSFIEQSEGWKKYVTKKIKKNEIAELEKLVNNAHVDENFLWGYGVNDVFICTTIVNKQIDVKPFFLISLNNLRNIERTVF